jgi:hypothetical protein
MKFKIEQVVDAASKIAVDNGFTSGESTSSGTYRYQFNKPGMYYYWSGFVDPSQTISFRGIIFVNDTTPNRELEINISLNDFKAQKCHFPFEYKSNTYKSNTYTFDSCIFGDQSFRWCSPTSVFNGQYLPCNYDGKF